MPKATSTTMPKPKTVRAVPSPETGPMPDPTVVRVDFENGEEVVHYGAEAPTLARETPDRDGEAPCVHRVGGPQKHTCSLVFTREW